jgi:hypothetical protein
VGSFVPVSPCSLEDGFYGGEVSALAADSDSDDLATDEWIFVEAQGCHKQGSGLTPEADGLVASARAA